MSRAFVVGHVNPDTDAIAAAMGYAWLLETRDQAEVVAARAGSLNDQTAWVLNRLGLDPPELLADAAARLDAVARRLDTVLPDRPLREAWKIAHRTRAIAPVVSADGKPYGLITGASLFNFLSKLVGTDPEARGNQLEMVFDLPSREAADVDVPKFLRNTRIRDALPRILREERNAFFVVDEAGSYFGVIRQRDLLNPPRQKLIFVDHTEPEHSVGSLGEAELLEVLDHHRLDNPPTRSPIRFRIEPVGSTSTLVSEQIEEAGLSAPPELAGLLLAGLLSDTLLLTSPTTTDRDRAAAERLGRWAFVGGGPLEGESLESFGNQLLETGTGLSARDPQSVVTADLKVYDAAEMRFGIAQVEVTDLAELSDRLELLQGALDRLKEEQGLDFAMLMVTDIVDASSQLMMRGAPPVLDELPYPRSDDGTLLAEGVVSRKKQLLPVVLALLEG